MKYLYSLLLLFFCFVSLNAQPPSEISWQGILRDSNDDLLDGQYSITFKIYDSQTASTSLWSSTRSLNINDGIVNVILGEVNSLNLDFDTQYWLEIQIGSGTPLSRIKLTGTAYTNNVVDGRVVKSIGKTQNLKDNVDLIEGPNITIEDNTPNPNDIRISSGSNGMSIKLINNVFVVVNNFGDTVIKINPNGFWWWWFFGYFTEGFCIPPEDGDIGDPGGIEVHPIGHNDEGISVGGGPNGEEETKIEDDMITVDGDENDDGGIEIGAENGIVITDSNGDTTYVQNRDGTSFHKGKEEFAGGISIPTNNGEIVIDDSGIHVKDNDGNDLVHFDENGNSFHEKLEQFNGGINIPLTGGGFIQLDQDGIRIYDASENLLTEFNRDGTSTHNGLETYNGGIKVPLSGGGYIMLDDSGFTIYDTDDNIVTDLNEDGTSTHTGLETYEGGLEVPMGGGVNIKLDENGIGIYDSEGDPVYKQSGTISIHNTPEVFKSGITVNGTLTGETITGNIVDIKATGSGSNLLEIKDQNDNNLIHITGTGETHTNGSGIHLGGGTISGGGLISGNSIEGNGLVITGTGSGSNLIEIKDQDDNNLIHITGTGETHTNGHGINLGGGSVSGGTIDLNLDDAPAGESPMIIKDSFFNVIFEINKSGNVNINENTMISGGISKPDQVDIEIESLALQSVPPLRVKDQSGTDIFSVGSDGTLSSHGNKIDAGFGAIEGGSLIASEGFYSTSGSLSVSNASITNGITIGGQTTINDNTEVNGDFNVDSFFDISSGSSLVEITPPSANDNTFNNGSASNPGEATGGAWNTFSDKRLKTNISKLTDALDKVKSLNGYKFNWKNNPDKNTQIGVIAQEIQKVYPELVKKGEDGFLSVNYANLSAILIEAIKEQQAMIDKQNSQINVLNNKLNSVTELKKQNKLLRTQFNIMIETIESLNKKTAKDKFTGTAKTQ